MTRKVLEWTSSSIGMHAYLGTNLGIFTPEVTVYLASLIDNLGLCGIQGLPEGHRARGWDENGIPRYEALKQLGLEEIDRVLKEKVR